MRHLINISLRLSIAIVFLFATHVDAASKWDAIKKALQSSGQGDIVKHLDTPNYRFSRSQSAHIVNVVSDQLGNSNVITAQNRTKAAEWLSIVTENVDVSKLDEAKIKNSLADVLSGKVKDVAGDARSFALNNDPALAGLGLSPVRRTDPDGPGHAKTPKASSPLNEALTSNPHPALRQIDQEIDAAVRANLPKREIDSLKHQRDLLRASTDPATLKKMGFNQSSRQGLLEGILDSDKGKLDSYKALLKDKNAKTPDGVSSDQLFDFLKGRSNDAAGKVLSDLLDEMGLQGRTLFNSNLSNDQLRAILSQKEMAVALGFLHEFPGMADALGDFRKGLISAEVFKKRLSANLFHNGPQAGFWNKITTEFLPGAMRNAPDRNSLRLFEGTVFEGSGDLLVQYPTSRTPEGIFHTNLDRMSQATGGGQIKIFEELPFLPPNVAVIESSLQNPIGTLEQIARLREDLTNVPNLSIEQRRTLEAAIDENARRVRSYQDATNARIVKNDTGDLVIDGVEFKKGANESDEAFRARVRTAHETTIQEIESSELPMRRLSE